MTQRYEYRKGSNVTIPARGSQGIAWAASGYDDPESAEFGAVLFQPDGDENAYYCDPSDLVPVSPLA